MAAPARRPGLPLAGREGSRLASATMRRAPSIQLGMVRRGGIAEPSSLVPGRPRIRTTTAGDGTFWRTVGGRSGHHPRRQMLAATMAHPPQPAPEAAVGPRCGDESVIAVVVRAWASPCRAPTAACAMLSPGFPPRIVPRVDELHPPHRLHAGSRCGRPWPRAVLARPSRSRAISTSPVPAATANSG